MKGSAYIDIAGRWNKMLYHKLYIHAYSPLYILEIDKLYDQRFLIFYEVLMQNLLASHVLYKIMKMIQSNAFPHTVQTSAC